MIILPFQFDNLSDKDHLAIIRFNETVEEKLESCRVMANGDDVHNLAFRELTIQDLGIAIDALSAIYNQYDVLIKKIVDLQHFKDSKIGLWATDQKPSDTTSFFQIS